MCGFTLVCVRAQPPRCEGAIMTSWKTTLLFALSAALSACATVDDAVQKPLKPSTAWVAAGEGWAEEAEEVYAAATSYVATAAQTRNAKSWAVIMDLDETVLNNVAYQVSLDEAGASYKPETWYAWTQEKRASLVPGASAFIEFVNEAGGHVAFVTNRSDREQLATEENLAALGLTRGEDFRVLLTRARPNGPRSKEERFDLAPAMLSAQGYPDVAIIAYVGDNMGDKPATLNGAAFFCIDQGAMYGDPCAKVPGPGR